MNYSEDGKLTCGYAESSKAVDFHGTSVAFNEFAEKLKMSPQHHFYVPKKRAFPHDFFIDEFLVKESPGKLKVSLKGRTLVCEGEKPYLNKLADHVLGFSHSMFNNEMHYRIEPRPDHEYLAPDSLTLVFSRIS
jgi:hypothetical protein